MKFRAAKDHGKKFQSRLDTSFSGIVHCVPFWLLRFCSPYKNELTPRTSSHVVVGELALEFRLLDC